MKEKRLGILLYDESLLKELLHIPNCVDITRVFMDEKYNGNVSFVIEQTEDSFGINLPVVPKGHAIPHVSCTLKIEIK